MADIPRSANIKERVYRLINETQIITHAAEEHQPEIIEQALYRMELILGDIRAMVLARHLH